MCPSENNHRTDRIVYASPCRPITTDSNALQDFLNTGWMHFKFDPGLLKWVDHALPHAKKTVASPDNAQWLRCDGTWFVGVNVLNNDAQGRIGNSDPLRCAAISFLEHNFGATGLELDKAQISVCYPNYPQPGVSESVSSHHYRLHRDGAHVDGLLAVGPDRRRYLREHHAFVLGIPMTEFSTDAAPPVVWESSHEMVRAAFKELFANIHHNQWQKVDATRQYHALRREIFERCNRKKIQLKRGECLLVHRMALHGIAPWSETASAGPDGRMICYFRPQFTHPKDWLCAP